MFISLLAQRNEPKKCVAHSPRWLKHRSTKTQNINRFGLWVAGLHNQYHELLITPYSNIDNALF
ncbi:MAG: hypothetical protein GX365_05495 [Clostridiales bacterium]|nr:hypothetical protein [Clostridiales bacterium]